MFPYKTSFILERKSKQALYLQLSNQLIQEIKSQRLPPKAKLPGSRTLAELLNVHRKTIVACYEELSLQGWIETIPKKGTFVHAKLPLFNRQKLTTVKVDKMKKDAGFSFLKKSILNRKNTTLKPDFMYLNDGVSDKRLTPINEIAKTYRTISGRKNTIQDLGYGSTYGNEVLRKELTTYLNSTRGLNITKENVLITRGSQMGIYLSSKLLLQKEDVIVVGSTNYTAADTVFADRKVNLKRVSVDEKGINTKEIEKMCKNEQIKAVYVTSHHHHPTTVTLSAERRIHLLNLAKQYNFAIIEDDYDYDFNYNHSPILPLASHDVNGNVIYIGSVCKTVAPVFRVGYLIAAKEFVDEAANVRRFIDRQGDALLELTLANFIKSGDLDRHIKKVMKIYKARRDLFCELLNCELSTYFEFKIPKGGMAVWVVLNEKYSWKEVAVVAKKIKLEIGEWHRYDLAKTNHNGIRIGFAAYNDEEIYELIKRLKNTMMELKNIYSVKIL